MPCFAAEFNYNITYAAFCLLCSVIFLAMGTQINRNLGGRREILTISLLIGASFIESIAACASRLAAVYNINCPLFLNWLVNGLDVFATLFVCFFWFMLTSSKSTKIFFLRPRVFALTLIPLVIDSILILLSIWGGFIFYIDADGMYHRGSFFVVQILCSYFYYFLSIGICFDSLIRGSVMERDLFRKWFLYSLFPVLGGGFQVAVGVIPFTTATMSVSILYMFITIQNQRINTDAMTGLNNKLCTQGYVERIAKTATLSPFYFFIMDINKFKKINDNHGHLMGDRAILIVASVLKKIANEYNGFVGRFGGDEFTAVILVKRCPVPDILERQINTMIQDEMKEQRISVPLTICAGYTLSKEDDEDVSTVIERADKMLYQRKKTCSCR